MYGKKLAKGKKEDVATASIVCSWCGRQYLRPRENCKGCGASMIEQQKFVALREGTYGNL